MREVSVGREVPRLEPGMIVGPKTASSEGRSGMETFAGYEFLRAGSAWRRIRSIAALRSVVFEYGGDLRIRGSSTGLGVKC